MVDSTLVHGRRPCLNKKSRNSDCSSRQREYPRTLPVEVNWTWYAEHLSKASVNPKCR